MLILAEKNGSVTTITINRPEVRNVVNQFQSDDNLFSSKFKN